MHRVFPNLEYADGLKLIKINFLIHAFFLVMVRKYFSVPNSLLTTVVKYKIDNNSKGKNWKIDFLFDSAL